MRQTSGCSTSIANDILWKKRATKLILYAYGAHTNEVWMGDFIFFSLSLSLIILLRKLKRIAMCCWARLTQAQILIAKREARKRKKENGIASARKLPAHSTHSGSGKKLPLANRNARLEARFGGMIVGISIFYLPLNLRATSNSIAFIVISISVCRQTKSRKTLALAVSLDCDTLELLIIISNIFSQCMHIIWAVTL